MLIHVSDPILQTQIFTAIFLIAIIASIRKKEDKTFFSIATTTELKGIAMLAIVLSHIGYFLSDDTRFLFPLSILAGVGVDLFLFLSGYGLTISALKKKLSPMQFYLKRVSKIFIPMWITLISFLALDFFILHKTYPLREMVEVFLGFIREADLFNSIDSPLWFITLILFFYIVFPWLFKKEHPFMSALVLALLGYFMVTFGFEALWRVNHLHTLHFLAFPFGVLFAGLYATPNKIKMYADRFTLFLQQRRWLFIIGKILLACIALGVFLYFSLHSGMDKSKLVQQNISILTAFALIVVFLLKPFQTKFFTLVGMFSYEMYLVHWPLMYRYDIFYKYMPASVATVLYIALFLLIGWGMQYMIGRVPKLFKRKNI